jgi:polar amino acid transport system substrate-binding protein
MKRLTALALALAATLAAMPALAQDMLDKIKANSP